jgi:hypothetical protein
VGGSLRDVTVILKPNFAEHVASASPWNRAILKRKLNNQPNLITHKICLCLIFPSCLQSVQKYETLPSK